MPVPENKLPADYKGLGCTHCGATGAKIFTTGQVKKTTNCLTRPKTCKKCGAVTTTVETSIGTVPPVDTSGGSPGPSPEVDHVIPQVTPPPQPAQPVVAQPIAQPVAGLAAVAPTPIATQPVAVSQPVVAQP